MQHARSRAERLKCLECCQYQCKHLKHKFDACARPYGPKNRHRGDGNISKKRVYRAGPNALWSPAPLLRTSIDVFCRSVVDFESASRGGRI